MTISRSPFRTNPLSTTFNSTILPATSGAIVATYARTVASRVQGAPIYTFQAFDPSNAATATVKAVSAYGTIFKRRLVVVPTGAEAPLSSAFLRTVDLTSLRVIVGLAA